MKVKTVSVGGVKIGGRHSLALIAGPCVIESRAACLDLARRLTRLARREQIPFIFKASYDKANRSSHRAFRGPGLEEGLDILAEVKEACGVPVLTDVHSVTEVAAAGRIVDVLQIPAFLARQTDLLVAAGATRSVVNIKKGQFMSPDEMANAVAKVESGGGRRLLLTELKIECVFLHVAVRLLRRLMAFGTSLDDNLVGEIDRKHAASQARIGTAVGRT